MAGRARPTLRCLREDLALAVPRADSPAPAAHAAQPDGSRLSVLIHPSTNLWDGVGVMPVKYLATLVTMGVVKVLQIVSMKSA